MRFGLLLALFALVAYLPGCSALSMPSMAWFRSSGPADPTAEALFAEGNRYLKEKRYARAIDVLQKLKTEHPFTPLLPDAELKLADAYYLNEQYPEAIAAFKEFQALHPTNENIPFVTLRLGQAHLDQFTTIDRDQKNTELAKGFFETVVANYPKSPHAAEAARKLAQCIHYLSEHEFGIAYFYYQQEKYPAARDRFEEVVRKYKGTPTAIKSLYYLGESYKREKNWVKASLAYEALIQHYPQDKLAAAAKTQLAQLDREKQDPLALLLMRDRRPGAAAAPEVKEEPALARLRDLNMVAKKDIVHEEPGDEKTFLRRVADRLNPFSSSPRREERSESGDELLAEGKKAQKEESRGILASLWPFGRNSGGSKNTGLVNQIDESLKDKGVPSGQRASVSPPAADLPKVDEAPAKTMDTGLLLGAIDANLQKSGRSAGEAPQPPEVAEVFKNPAPQTATAKAAAPAPVNESAQSPATSDLLSNIDQKLQSRGVEPQRFEAPPSAAEVKQSTLKNTPPAVELEPKLSVEKGPLFLAPGDLQAQGAGTVDEAEKNDIGAANAQQPATRDLPKNLVRGPRQTSPTGVNKPVETRKPAPGDEEEARGLLDYLRDDVESIGRILNPFRW